MRSGSALLGFTFHTLCLESLVTRDLRNLQLYQELDFRIGQQLESADKCGEYEEEGRFFKKGKYSHQERSFTATVWDPWSKFTNPDTYCIALTATFAMEIVLRLLYRNAVDLIEKLYLRDFACRVIFKEDVSHGRFTRLLSLFCFLIAP